MEREPPDAPTRDGPRGRRVATVGACSLLVGLLIAVGFLAPWQGGVTPAGYDRIEPGMTAAEVEAILGRPPGRNTTHAVMGPDIGPREYCTGKTWASDRIVIQVWFDDRDGRVRHKEFRPVSGRPSLLRRLLRSLGL